MTVDTGKVQGRRDVHYESFQRLWDDAERLAERKVRTLGNWTFGQILEHLAKAMEYSIDGFPFKAPWPVRVIARLFLKKKFLTQSLPAGFQLPNKMKALLPEDVSVSEGLDHLRKAINRTETETTRAPHPALGRLTLEESNLLQLRHAEMHMSFVVEEES